jgi:hypothetical protein
MVRSLVLSGGEKGWFGQGFEKPFKPVDRSVYNFAFGGYDLRQRPQNKGLTALKNCETWKLPPRTTSSNR